MRTHFTAAVLLCLCLATVTNLQADEPQTETVITTTDTIAEDWIVAKTDPTAYATISETEPNPTIAAESHIEIVNDGSISTTRTLSPQNSGRLTFSAKHNKSGLLYIYAQTSDNGGQLVFSIQFTESRGILLEESNRQITLLPDYTADRWYEFVIDFDNARGNYGMFTVIIDGTLLGEFEYVHSESKLFDIAQITLGSESDGDMSVSAVTDSFISNPDVTATSTVNNALAQTSVSHSSTSISSNLDNGLLVTASLNGITSVSTSSVDATSPDTPETNSSTNTEESSGLGGFLFGIVDTVISLFTPEEIPPPTSEEPILKESEPHPEEDTIQSPPTNNDTNHEDITTGSF